MLELRQDDTVHYMLTSIEEVIKAVAFYKRERERHRLKAAKAYEKYKEQREKEKCPDQKIDQKID
jgi:hypothetical protein